MPTASPSAALRPSRNGGYTTREVADAVGLAPQRIRGFVQSSVLSPRRGRAGEYRFSFQDIVLMRTAKNLLDADVPSRKAVAALRSLRNGLAVGQSTRRPLSALRVRADGGAVVVRDKDALWNAQTGQGHLPFASEPLGEVRAFAKRSDAAAEERPAPASAHPAPVATTRTHHAAPRAQGAASGATGAAGESTDQPATAKGMDSDDWYNLGLDLEDADPKEAPKAYIQALALNPENADAHVNLGRLYQVDGDLKGAARHYQLALDIAPRHQLAHYNLGTVFDELGAIDTALTYYRLSPDVPDAHHNQARIYELRGDELASKRHMRKYKELAKTAG